jgi:DNA helicase HerA-like ATPase
MTEALFSGPGRSLGTVVGGSLNEGVAVKLDSDISIEEMAVGRYTVVEGGQKRFFGMITDVKLESIDPRLAINPPDASDPFIAEVLSGTALYGGLKVIPMLTIASADVGLVDGPQPVRTIPSHFSRVREASDEDMALVFGSEDERHFYIGNPLDMETKVCLNLEEYVKRSNGVFGKSGTGKTFLTRLLLIGMIQKNVAVNLIFDMHNEYGWEGSSESAGGKVKGLRQLFASKVAVFTLDPESSRRRGVSTDAEVLIGFDEIDPGDIALLQDTLYLSNPAVEASYSLVRKFGPKKWLSSFLEMEGSETGELALEMNVNEAALSALHRRLQILHRMPFLVPKAEHDSVKRILGYLDRGMNVVLEFGRHENNTAAYILVANLLTRRIHERYVRRAEKAMGEGGAKPRPLVITIEEAHKFLSPGLAGQTTFGAIAREMRKYNVTLLVIDQRPSGIDDEVMSQMGTKITCLLDNERDIDSVLTGVSGSRHLRTVLAGLDSRQQALIFGHAVPMPIVVKTREYGSAESYQSLMAPGAGDREEGLAPVESGLDDLFGESG